MWNSCAKVLGSHTTKNEQTNITHTHERKTDRCTPLTKSSLDCKLIHRGSPGAHQKSAAAGRQNWRSSETGSHRGHSRDEYGAIPNMMQMQLMIKTCTMKMIR